MAHMIKKNAMTSPSIMTIPITPEPSITDNNCWIPLSSVSSGSVASVGMVVVGDGIGEEDVPIDSLPVCLEFNH